MTGNLTEQSERNMLSKIKVLSTSVLLATALFATQQSVAHASEYLLGNLVIQDAVAKSTLPNAPVSGGYMIIRNNGENADRLISASAEFAGKTEIHEMKMENDVMKMRPLIDGLEIPGGGEVTLKPGGYHVMFMGLKERLVSGEMRKGILTFEQAGSIEVEFMVKDPDALSRMENSNHSN
jgi:copper(I)-binding protein